MNKVGAWSSEELLQTVKEELASVPIFDSLSQETEQFIAHAIDTFRNTESNNIGTALFILDIDPPTTYLSHPLNVSHTLNTGRLKFDNLIAFVNSKFSRGRYFNSDLKLPDEMIETFAKDHKYGCLPTILLDIHQQNSAIRVFPYGLNSDMELAFRLEKEALDLDKIKTAIDKVHSSSLITPSANANANIKLWNDAGKFFPEDNIEKLIQGRLYTFFSATFGCGFAVLAEVTDAGGRLDLLLLSKSKESGIQTNHAVIELKALRSFSTSGKTVYTKPTHLLWIEKGMRQAYEYKNTHNPHHAILCCFDMCKTDNTDNYWFDDTAQFSKQNEIHQWRWKIYNSAENKRESTIKLNLPKSN